MLGALVLVLAAGSARAEVIHIKIQNLAFAPAEITAHVGDTIEWANADFIPHTATAKNHDFDVQLPAGKTAKLNLKKAGTVEYFCRFHPNMTGTITVEEARR